VRQSFDLPELVHQVDAPVFRRPAVIDQEGSKNRPLALGPELEIAFEYRPARGKKSGRPHAPPRHHVRRPARFSPQIVELCELAGGLARKVVCAQITAAFPWFLSILAKPFARRSVVFRSPVPTPPTSHGQALRRRPRPRNRPDSTAAKPPRRIFPGFPRKNKKKKNRRSWRRFATAPGRRAMIRFGCGDSECPPISSSVFRAASDGPLRPTAGTASPLRRRRRPGTILRRKRNRRFCYGWVAGYFSPPGTAEKAHPPPNLSGPCPRSLCLCLRTTLPFRAAISHAARKYGTSGSVRFSTHLRHLRRDGNSTAVSALAELVGPRRSSPTLRLRLPSSMPARILWPARVRRGPSLPTPPTLAVAGSMVTRTRSSPTIFPAQPLVRPAFSPPLAASLRLPSAAGQARQPIANPGVDNQPYAASRRFVPQARVPSTNDVRLPIAMMFSFMASPDSRRRPNASGIAWPSRRKLKLAEESVADSSGRRPWRVRMPSRLPGGGRADPGRRSIPLFRRVRTDAAAIASFARRKVFPPNLPVRPCTAA